MSVCVTRKRKNVTITYILLLKKEESLINRHLKEKETDHHSCWVKSERAFEWQEMFCKWRGPQIRLGRKLCDVEKEFCKTASVS